MLQLVGLVYGLIALVTGKFFLGKGRKATGRPARMAGLVLVLEPFVAFAIGMGLGLSGMEIAGAMIFGVELVLLVAAFGVAFMIATKAARAQEEQGQGFTQGFGQSTSPAFGQGFGNATAQSNSAGFASQSNEGAQVPPAQAA